MPAYFEHDRSMKTLSIMPCSIIVPVIGYGEHLIQAQPLVYALPVPKLVK